MRKGTRAAAMKEQVLEAVKTRRSSVLLEMEAQKSKEYRSQFVGSAVKVLFEENKEIKGRTYMIGHTREYVKVAVETSQNLTNQIWEVQIEAFLEDEILLGNLSFL